MIEKKKRDAQYIEGEFKVQCFRSQSRWYSTKKVIDLKKQYEKENGFKYDVVVVVRFDNHWNYPLISFKQFQQDKIYAESRANRADGQYTVNDLWFVGNSENIDVLGSLYDNRYAYCIRPPFAVREHLETMLGKNIFYLQ